MKTLIARLISTALMLIIPVYVFFPENIILQKLMLGNEFLHWLSLLLLPLGLFILSKENVAKSLRGEDELGLGYLRELESHPRWEAFIFGLDVVCWLVLVLLLNDWSFSIALFLGILLSNLYNSRKKEAVELLAEHDAKK